MPVRHHEPAAKHEPTVKLSRNDSAKSLVIVLGAGIQGVSVALAMVHAGWRVELLDRAPAPLLGTSLAGEGKLHLGYVYGNEPGRMTAGLMVDGALAFAESLDRWVPRPIDWAALRSEPFRYAILADSMVPPDTLAEHYHWVDEAIAEGLGGGASYAGLRTLPRSRRLPSVRDAGYSGDVVEAYETGEVAVDPGLLRSGLIGAMELLGINFRPHCAVRQVDRRPHGFSVTATKPDGAIVTLDADAVVNCLWDGRLAVDATMGILPPRSCLYRFKYAVNVTMPSGRAPAARPLTTTFALGPYGDVVRQADGRIYLSWYPVCLAGLSTGLEPPPSWRSLLDEPDTTGMRMQMASATVAALAGRIEALREVRIDSVTGGVVVAWGDSDIDQPRSELHRRHAIGVHDHDGYLSVDTGKLTTAPMFAERVAQVLGSYRKGGR